MCFDSRPHWEDDVEFANRPPQHKRSRSRVVEETIVRKSSPRPPVEYIRTPTPPPQIIRGPSPPPRIEVVTVEEEARRKRHSHNGGNDRESEVYIERIREREPVREEYDTYRYVEAPESQRRRSRSITQDSSPRASGRLVERERERVVFDDGRRRREYHR